MRIAMMESCLPFERRIDAATLAAEAGAEGVEWIFYPGDVARLSDAAHLTELRRRADQAGVAIPSFCLSANCHTDGLIRSSAETRAAMETVRTALDAAHALGAPVVLLPFFAKAAIETEEELAFACDRLSELEEQADELGVVLGIESMLAINQKQFLIDHTGGGVAVKHYCDVGNVTARKLDPAIEIRDLGAGRICGVHFKDVRVREGQPPDSEVRLGEGQVPFAAVVSSLRAIGYDGWITLETPPLDDPAATARHNVQFARKLLEG